MLLAVVLSGLCAGQAVAEKAEEKAPVAVMGVTDGEIGPLMELVEHPVDKDLLGFPTRRGTIGGEPVILVVTGVGKVNAAAATAVLLDRVAPRAVVFAGVGGAIGKDLRPLDVVVVEASVQHDLVAVESGGDGEPVLRPRQVSNPLDGTRNPTTLPADGGLVAKLMDGPEKLPGGGRVGRGTAATGDAFVASTAKKLELRERFGAAVVDMESAAAAQICWQQNVPFAAVRAITDSADESAARDVKANYRPAVENASAVVLRLFAAALPEGQADKPAQQGGGSAGAATLPPALLPTTRPGKPE